MTRGIEIRLAKLEAKAPPPPSPCEGMTCDELSVMLLEEYSKVLADSKASAEDKTDAKREMAHITWEITATVNLASGRWMKSPGFQNYQERIASAKLRWGRLQPDRGEYVPALNQEIE
jgi:hypothetical protein